MVEHKIQYHRLVRDKDMVGIDKPDRIFIYKNIHKRLVAEPEKAGKPLRGELRGYFSLHLSQFRVVYRVHKGNVEVFVLALGFRRNEEVYLQAAKRLKLL